MPREAREEVEALRAETPPTARAAPGEAGASPTSTSPSVVLLGARSVPILVDRSGVIHQVLRLDVENSGPLVVATASVDGGPAQNVLFRVGTVSADIEIPAVATATPFSVTLTVPGQDPVETVAVAEPVRRWELHLLPHSHVDIGWTKPQEEIRADQRGYIEQAIALSKATEDYPDGATFKWNVEVLWAVDGYLEQATPEQRADFLDAVDRGWIGLDALYGNALTGLHSREELVHLLDEARELREQYGFEIDSAMITDLPGYAWGTIPVLADTGIRYWSIGANFVRAGNFHRSFDDVPFYWVEPGGQREVLTWSSGEGYSFFALKFLRDGTRVVDLLDELEEKGYPYDITYLRYVVFDNFGPDTQLSEFVRDWNEAHIAPKIRLSTTREPFEALEARYGHLLPRVAGDWSPYWEDGAASTALETALNRRSVQRLEQAERLWGMLDPAGAPFEEFATAWRQVLLFHEHSWGAFSSISAPEDPLTIAIWQRKQANATEGDRLSREILASATGGSSEDPVSAVRVYNTSGWPRAELIRVPAAWNRPGDRVTTHAGVALPSQVLSNGDLAFVSSEIPAFGQADFRIDGETPLSKGSAHATQTSLANERLTIGLDSTTGAVASLRLSGLDVELIDASQGPGVNEYLYVPGRDPSSALGGNATRFSVLENGPLLAEVAVTVEAPGASSVEHRIAVVSGADSVRLSTHIDKNEIFDPEAVHLAFPFAVPDATPRIDTPWAIVEVDRDQIDGSNKNHLLVQNFVDFSNEEFGITWTSLDAPLVEIAGLNADAEEVGYLDTIGSSARLYSFLMNNYWFTNYKAAQSGLVDFVYEVRPHTSGFDPVAASRFGEAARQPLIVVPGQKPGPPRSLLEVTPAQVHVSTLKPTSEGELTLRLYGLTPQTMAATVDWRGPGAIQILESNLNDEALAPIEGPITIPGQGMATVRIAVPEPSAALQGLAALVSMVLLARRRKRGRAPTPGSRGEDRP